MNTTGNCRNLGDGVVNGAEIIKNAMDTALLNSLGVNLTEIDEMKE